MGEGEFVAQQLCRGYGHLDAADRPTDPGADFAQGEPQLGRQQMAAAEDVERQVAGGIGVAMAKPALLVRGQRQVGSVEVENDLPRQRLAMGLEEQVDE